MRLLISGGGTGGHLSPALAVAQAFKAAHPAAEVLLAGRVGGLEERMAPAAGVPLETVRVRGFDRDRPLRNLALPMVLVHQAFRSSARARDSNSYARLRSAVGSALSPILIGNQYLVAKVTRARILLRSMTIASGGSTFGVA